jgi:hypothetical protein
LVLGLVVVTVTTVITTVVTIVVAVLIRIIVDFIRDHSFRFYIVSQLLAVSVEKGMAKLKNERYNIIFILWIHLYCCCDEGSFQINDDEQKL